MSRVPIIDRASSGARQSRWHRDLVDVVSGATYASYAYVQSLQAALDAATQR
jgi:uncharacterized protein with FMN-binding domain